MRLFPLTSAAADRRPPRSIGFFRPPYKHERLRDVWVERDGRPLKLGASTEGGGSAHTFKVLSRGRRLDIMRLACHCLTASRARSGSPPRTAQGDQPAEVGMRL